jgi:hypothetical protein
MNASDINQPTMWARREVSSGFARRGGDASPGNSKPLEWNERVCGEEPGTDASMPTDTHPDENPILY